MFSPTHKGRKIRLVENSVERTARMLSHEYDIRVVWKPNRCETDGRTIILPTIPPDAPDDLLEAMQGFLDHETAHVLFTDFTVGKNYKPTLDREQFSCFNVVEDLRIEEKIIDIFPGSVYNLHNAHTWTDKKLEENWSQISQFNKAISAYFTFQKYGEHEDFWKRVVDDTTKDLVRKCVAVTGTFTSTKEALQAGLRIYEVLKESAEQEKQEREKREAEGMTSKEGEGEPIPGMPGDLGALIKQEAAKLLQAYSTNKQQGFRNYEHDKAHDNTYIVYTTQSDTYAMMPDGNLAQNGKRLHQLRDESRTLTSVLRTKLVNTLRAQSKRRWMGGKEDGKLDTRKLYRALLGNPAVYKQQTDKLALDTVIVLAIDNSGSMQGRKLELAGETAILIGDVLNTLKIPFMTYGYSTERAIEYPQDTSIFARWGHLWIRHYNEFGESWEKGATRLAGAMANVKNNTLDAESVKYGARRLLQRPEKRKILLVLNDGMPNPGYGHMGRCQQHLHDVVASATDAGVEVIAFGIESSDVKVYYPHHVVINKLEDIVKEPLVVLDQILRKGMYK